MAITVTNGAPVSVMAHPILMTKVAVTITLDGTLQTVTHAGSPHGGPSGATPVYTFFTRNGGDSTDTLVTDFNVNNYDTTNNEVDWKAYWSAAGTNTKTLIYNMITVFNKLT